MADDNVKTLMDYLSAREPAEARRIQPELAELGLFHRVMFRGPAASPEGASLDGQPSQDVRIRQQQALLGLVRTALKRAINDFEAVRPRIESRIKRAGRLRLASALITTILSSGVVASLNLPKGSSWSILLGVLALLSSILTLLAGRLEGGEAHLANTFAEVASNYAEARHILDKADLYLAHSEIFSDLEAVTSRAAELCTFIQKAIIDWNLA
jgi:hypothetical protein